MTLAVKWIPSPNYTPGRAGHNPMWSKADPNTWIVLHTQDGFQANTIAAFQTVKRQASSNYVVSLVGAIVQMVRETDGPWTNGTMAGIGSNLDSITIECEDGGNFNGPRTPELYEAAAQLVADIARRRGIPLVHRGGGGGILRHRECQGSSTACPDSLDVGRIINRAIAINHPVADTVDTRPEWQKNTKMLSAPFTFNLSRPVAMVRFSTNAFGGNIPAGTLTVVAETTVGVTAYFLTDTGRFLGDGIPKTEVMAAITVPPIVAIPSPAVPPVLANLPAPSSGSVADWAASLASHEIAALIQFLQEHLGSRTT